MARAIALPPPDRERYVPRPRVKADFIIRIESRRGERVQVARTKRLAKQQHELRRLSVGQALDIYRAFQPGMDFVIANRSKLPGLKSAAVLGAFAFVHAVKAADAPLRFARLNSGVGLEHSPALRALREFLMQNDSMVMMRNLHRGIVELVLHGMWLDCLHPDKEALDLRPEEWQKAAEYFRSQQPKAVAKIAALFQLP